MTRRFRRRVERGERGAALVEFALIFPIFMTLVLGMFSGGQSYNRKITITNAAREGARYGATLAPGPLRTVPPDPCCGIDDWIIEVADVVEQNAEGDLDASVNGREICVAYVYPAADPANHGEVSHMVRRTTTDSLSDGAAAMCFNDGRPSTERRVQVAVSRPSSIELLFLDYGLTLTAQSVTRFEATSF